MSSICNLWLTPAQWALHTSLALWWRRWWKCSPALGSTLGLADWGLEEEEGVRSNRARETGRRKVGTGGGRCCSNGAQGERRGEGREKVSWASAPPSHASCVRFWKQQLSCPEEWWRVQMLVHLLNLSRFRLSPLPETFSVGSTVRKRKFISVEKASNQSSKLL